MEKDNFSAFQVREERTGGEERMKMRTKKENWCLKKMVRVRIPFMEVTCLLVLVPPFIYIKWPFDCSNLDGPQSYAFKKKNIFLHLSCSWWCSKLNWALFEQSGDIPFLCVDFIQSKFLNTAPLVEGFIMAVVLMYVGILFQNMHR